MSGHEQSAENDVPTRCIRCHGDRGWYGLHGVWEPCPDCDPARPIPPGGDPTTDHGVYRCACVTDDHEKPHARILPPGAP